MISSSFDLWVAIGVFLLMPAIIWGNLYNRQSGVMGYLWRESPWLVRIGIAFLALTWLATAGRLSAYYGLISQEAAQVAATVLGIPMLVLSLTILVMGTMALARYLRSRRSA